MNPEAFPYLFEFFNGQDPLLVCGVVGALVIGGGILVLSTIRRVHPVIVWVVLSGLFFGFSQAFRENRSQWVGLLIGDLLWCGVATWWWFSRVVPGLRGKLGR